MTTSHITQSAQIDPSAWLTRHYLTGTRTAVLQLAKWLTGITPTTEIMTSLTDLINILVGIRTQMAEATEAQLVPVEQRSATPVAEARLL